MSHDEIRELLGAYSLDAVEGPARDEISEHLLGCESCRNEVNNHREVASMLAVVTSDDAQSEQLSDSLWASIERSIDTSDSLGEITTIVNGARSRSRSGMPFVVMSVAAALLLVAVVASLVQVSRLNSRVSTLSSVANSERMSQDLINALLSENYHTVRLTAPSGAAPAFAVVNHEGQSFFVNRHLSTVGPQWTYQLWALSGTNVVSLGVLGRRPEVETFQFQRSMTEILLNVEPRGGSTTPTTPVLASGLVA